MAGDVASAFRHVGIHSHSVYLFGGIIPELGLLIIDLFCPFGWTGSPSCYEVFGGAISHVHHMMPTPFVDQNFRYHWVDDHVCVTASDATQTDFVETSLRRAMTTILGSHAINEAKFTGWHKRLKILGLVFDTTDYIVSMPASKIAKAQAAVSTAFHASLLRRSSYRSLMGSLRHVATCLRSARAFLQRLRVHERRLHRFSQLAVTDDMREDLRWWWAVLRDPTLNGVPMDHFNTSPAPDFVVEVDASDSGCCAMDITSRRFIRYTYTPDERKMIAALKAGVPTTFDINLRPSPPVFSGNRGSLADYLRDHSVAKSTYAKYRRAFERWQRWCMTKGTHPWLIGRSESFQAAAVSDFILYCVYRPGFPPIKSRTVANILHGVNHFFAARGLLFPVGHPQVRMLLQGLHRLDRPERRKHPVSIQLLRAVYSSLNMTAYPDQALWGVLCLAFFFLLRKSEILADGSRFKWFALRASDIIVRDAQGCVTSLSTRAASVTIRLQGSKTNQSGPETVRSLTRSGDTAICPVLGAICLRRAHGQLPESLPAATFQSTDMRPEAVNNARLLEVLRVAAVRIGLDPQCVSAHSLRSGGATHMHRAGIDATTIQLHGRWASDAFKRYTRLCSDSVRSIASSMITGSSSNVSLD